MDYQKIMNLFESYTNEDLKRLEEIEQYFHLNEFTLEDADTLGMMIVEESKTYSNGIAIQIIDEKNNKKIFQHIMDGKTEKNIDYVNAKRNAVLKTKHCSVWGFMKYSIEGKSLQEVFSDSQVLYSAGAFPIYVKHELTYTIGVSGLKEGKDFSVVVDAFAKFIKKDIPQFTKELI